MTINNSQERCMKSEGHLACKSENHKNLIGREWRLPLFELLCKDIRWETTLSSFRFFASHSRNIYRSFEHSDVYMWSYNVTNKYYPGRKLTCSVIWELKVLWHGSLISVNLEICRSIVLSYREQTESNSIFGQFETILLRKLERIFLHFNKLLTHIFDGPLVASLVWYYAFSLLKSD